jgi:phage baseplate assembly protein W
LSQPHWQLGASLQFNSREVDAPHFLKTGMSIQGSCLSHPFRPDVRGTTATIATRDAIVAESIKSIIETRQGERVMVPDYGIPDFVFSVADFAFAARLGYFVQLQIKNYEPLVDKVSIKPGELTDAGFVAGLSQGRVALSITYTVRGSNVPRNLVYPVWQLQN